MQFAWLQCTGYMNIKNSIVVASWIRLVFVCLINNCLCQAWSKPLFLGAAFEPPALGAQPF